MNRTRGIKNAIFGILSQLLIIVVGIMIPRLVLVNLGSEANGLLSSIGNILAYLSLLEAGVGTATLQALYKPCAENNHPSSNSIMAATDYFYRKTGIIYLVIVLLLSACYSLFVQTDLPRLDVFAVVLLSGLTSVISFFFQGKFKIFLAAEGKAYVNTNIATFIQIGTSLTKAVLLAIGFGVVAVQVSGFAFNLLQMSIYALYMNRHYPWLNMKVKPDFDAISQKNAVLVHQISGLIFSNTDVLLLTVFTSLKEVSVYTMYAMIYGMAKMLAVILYNSYTYALGQSYNTDKTRFLRMFDAYEVMTMIITFSLYCICRLLINPFLSLYTRGVNDIEYVNAWLPWLFAIFYLLHNGRISSSTVIDVSQHFEDTKWRSVLESIINVTVSLICVNCFGIYGVLMGTIAALLYRTNDMIIYSAGILGRSCWITYKRWIINLVVFFGLSFALDQVPVPANDYLQLIGEAVPISILIILVFFSINLMFNRDSVLYVIQVIKNIVKDWEKRLRKNNWSS